jgi:Dyp-type peroxidase family
MDRSPPSSLAHLPSAEEPALDIDDIQGNILAGFNKDYQHLVALKLSDAASARSWLRRILPSINTLAEVGHFNAAFRMRRARLGRDPIGLIATWTNIAFSHPGLAALTSEQEADGVPDEAFNEGMPSRAGILGEAAPSGKTDPTAGWVIGGTGNVPDILLIIASDDQDELSKALAHLQPSPGDGPNPPQILWQERGQTRSDLPGHEHFGFKDGIAQPGVRGRVSGTASGFLTPRLLAASPLPDMEFSAPGQPLVWPGQFVFGYPATDGSSGSTGGPVPPAALNPPWLKNGSLLVFRRLRQNVAAFNQFLQVTAQRLGQLSDFAGMTADRLGALIVGRWPSGAPVMRSPAADNPALGQCPLANNDFLYTIDTPPPELKPQQPPVNLAFPTANEDAEGFVCPHAAHIRKVNPRDQDSDKGNQFDTLTRRILRRGIPYGPPLTNPLIDDGVDRGLHFLCYQTSIGEQFELLQTDWANNFNNPKSGGIDLIIGQTPGQPRHFELDTPSGGSTTFPAPQQFVVATGGGYFFAPSISALRDVIAK